MIGIKRPDAIIVALDPDSRDYWVYFEYEFGKSSPMEYVICYNYDDAVDVAIDHANYYWSDWDADGDEPYLTITGKKER